MEAACTRLSPTRILRQASIRAHYILRRQTPRLLELGRGGATDTPAGSRRPRHCGQGVRIVGPDGRKSPHIIQPLQVRQGRRHHQRRLARLQVRIQNLNIRRRLVHGLDFSWNRTIGIRQLGGLVLFEGRELGGTQGWHYFTSRKTFR